jgi:MFS transporter, DHA1 family, multidrug resistance protein
VIFLFKREFVILCFSIFIADIGIGIIIPMLPIYINSLGTTGFTMGIIFSSLAVSMAFFTPIIGRLSDKIGKKVFITCGFAFSALIALAYTWVTNPYQFILVRFLNGISLAMIIPVIMAYVGELSPPGKEGSYMGIYSMAMFLGTAAGPLCGGIIVNKAGMFPAFYFYAGAMVVAFLITIFLPRRVRSSTTSLAKSPFKEIMKSNILKGILIFALILAIAQSSLMVFVPLLAKEQKLTILQIGILASVFIFSAGILQAPFGYLANRYNRGRLVVVSVLFIAIGLAIMPLAHGFMSLLCICTFVGIAAATGVPAGNALMAESSREIGMGVVSGSMNTFFNVGSIIGPVAAGIIMDAINIDFAFYLISVTFFISTAVFYMYAREIIHTGRKTV